MFQLEHISHMFQSEHLKQNRPNVPTGTLERFFTCHVLVYWSLTTGH
jgi:hypothetical protein